MMTCGVAHFLHLLRQQRAQLLAHRRVNAPGAPVGDDAFGVERAEVGARRHVARPQFQAQAQRLDDAAAHLEFQRVVAKQAQVSRPAARSDARRNRDHPSLRRVFGQRIQVGGDRRFERREIALLARGDVAHAVQHHQRQLGGGLQSQFRIKSIQIHNSVSVRSVLWVQVTAQTAVTDWQHNAREPPAPSTRFGPHSASTSTAPPFNTLRMAQVVLEHLTKVFQGPGGETVRAVDNACLVVEDKELLVLVGPSGCGKTTTLRLIAGLEEPTAGTISINGQVVNDLPPKDRDIAMVFQNYALYPHMSVYENMAFGLKLRHFPRAEIDQRVQDAAQILDLTACLDRKPAALSGGQRQRVALGRALVRQPEAVPAR